MALREDRADLEKRLIEAECRLRSIRELSVDQVLVEGTTDQRFVDAEGRLSRIHDLATGDVNQD
jgi:hypothetical protein